MSTVATTVRTLPEPGTDGLERDTLLRIAVARGCRHYAPLLPSDMPSDDAAGLPHEMLGAALLRGPTDADTFQAIRCGAMVLSDLGNSPQRIIEASQRFGVTHRLAHLARLGLAADQHPEFWAAILSGLPRGSSEEQFLPGVSRLVSETHMAAPGRQPARTWLRTRYAR